LNKIWSFIKDNFLTRKFITFGVIGIINTLIHLGVYGIFYNQLSAGAFLSNTAAFITASVFSYFANAYFTFKPKHKTTTQFSIVVLVFLTRLFISSLLASAFDYMVINWFNIDYELYPLATYIAPFFASALLIPVAYLALNFVFKKTSEIKEKNINE
jgi:putative flippase GtrA